MGESQQAAGRVEWSASGECPKAGSAGSPSAEEAELLQRWSTLAAGFRELSDQLLGDAQREIGLPQSLLEVLCFLATAPEQAAPMRLVAQTLGFSTAGTTGVVDKLADAGLVERRPSRSDRRVTYAALTPQGRETATAVARVFADSVRRRVVQPLGAEGFASFAGAFATLGLGNGSCPGDAAAEDS
ncbi:MarR family transcriptional regulator [Streptomyces sp. NPDC093544]|jgi:DNA-binding MarR family transcriptional regulator|uniref:MarR family winged helix-turn-helix transcriptional regulator n=1 Tax=Streptomyces sp. NPDC093544 TaxID=3155200 RepID=UPI00343A32F5